jgi:hypothetical protein
LARGLPCLLNNRCSAGLDFYRLHRFYWDCCSQYTSEWKIWLLFCLCHEPFQTWMLPLELLCTQLNSEYQNKRMSFYEVPSICHPYLFFIFSYWFQINWFSSSHHTNLDISKYLDYSEYFWMCYSLVNIVHPSLLESSTQNQLLSINMCKFSMDLPRKMNYSNNSIRQNWSIR